MIINWNGIQSMVGWIGQQISGFASGILGGFKSALGIASPSKVMRDHYEIYAEEERKKEKRKKVER